MIYTDETTCDDVIKAWDAGDIVWSVELGGLGPGYEQCIQVLGMELLREFKDLDWSGDEGPPGWKEIVDRRVHELDAKYRFSGAQVSAATNMACVFAKQGPRRALDKAPDRQIQISKNFPS